MTDNFNKQDKPTVVEQAVTEGGAYEVIRKRLNNQGKQLETQIRDLNKAREEEFGSTQMKVLSRLRLRTENNVRARRMFPPRSANVSITCG